MPPSQNNNNPVTNAHESAEMARAREMASLVQKSRIGAHTDKTTPPPIQQTTHNTPQESASPANPTLGVTTEHVPTLNEQALRILGDAALSNDHNQIQKPPTPPPTSQTEPPTREKHAERINENTSLTSQAAVLHTLNQDVQTLVKDRKISMVRAIALESDSNPHIAQFAQKNTQKQSPRSLLFMLAAVCIVFAIGIIAGAWYIQGTRGKDANKETSQAYYDTALVFYEHTQPFDVTDLTSYELLGNLAHLRDSIPSSLGSITLLNMFSTRTDIATGQKHQESLTVDTFLTQAHFEVPDELKRVLNGEYMVLVHQGTSPTPVILFSVTEPTAAFSGMLKWEKRMAINLSPFFPLGTLTLTETPPTFVDLPINNIDARILYDGDRHSVIVYALLEGNVYAITNNVETLQEISVRLHTQRLKRQK